MRRSWNNDSVLSSDYFIEKTSMTREEKSFVKNLVKNLSFAGNLSPEKSIKSWKMLPTIPDEKELSGDLV